MSKINLTAIYLDTNVYSRPFDDQTQPGIREEANAFLEIVSEIKEKRLALLCSDILAFEVYNILSGARKTPPRTVYPGDSQRPVKKYLSLCSEHIDNSEDVLKLGKRIQNHCQVRARDALHVASAILGGARYFLSCDNKVTQMKQGRCHRHLARSYRGEYFSVMNPVFFAEKIKRGKLE